MYNHVSDEETMAILRQLAGNIIVVLAGLLLFSACQADEQSDQQRLQEMKKDILAMIGTPTCGGEGSCRYIGLGSKPCGGYWEYVIYSVENVEPEVLVRKVNEYNEFEEELNAKYGYVSDCTVPEPPDPGCVNGRCVDLKKSR